MLSLIHVLHSHLDRVNIESFSSAGHPLCGPKSTNSIEPITPLNPIPEPPNSSQINYSMLSLPNANQD